MTPAEVEAVVNRMNDLMIATHHPLVAIGIDKCICMLREALAKSEAARDRGTLINEAASAGAALVDARERLDRTPREKVADHDRARSAHVDAVGRYARAHAALVKVTP